MNIFDILKARPEDSHKGTFGTLNIVAGSAYFRGAAQLNVCAALRCGAGIVRLCSTERVIAAAAAKISECVFLPLPENESGAISSKGLVFLMPTLMSGSASLIGCGMTNSAETAMIVTAAIEKAPCRLILDADALNSIAGKREILRSCSKPPIITPHIGEMARLCSVPIDTVKAMPDKFASDFAQNFNCVVVLKDHNTRVAAPDRRLYVNSTGNAGLARGGSGDVLAGMIAAFAAQGIDAYDAAVAGVYLHGLAADRCAARLSQYGMLPSDILADLCEIFRENRR